MSIQIENITNRPVLLRSNSGQAIYLVPGGISQDITDFEVKSNPMVQKLLDQRVVALHKGSTKAAPKKKTVASVKSKTAKKMKSKGHKK